MGAFPTTTLVSEERERQILEYLPQVQLIVRNIHRRLPESVNRDDLVSAGIIGLINAIDRFEPSRGLKLKTYAERKIRGAIFDNLRALDLLPRKQRKRVKQIEAAIRSAEQHLKRVPNEDEIAAELRVSIDEYRKWLVGFRGVQPDSFERFESSDDSVNLLEFISDDEERWPSKLLEKSELRRFLFAEIEKMPNNEKLVLSRYFNDELTLKEISKVLGLHPTRISQLKAQAILRLRCSMQNRWGSDHY